MTSAFRLIYRFLLALELLLLVPLAVLDAATRSPVPSTRLTLITPLPASPTPRSATVKELRRQVVALHGPKWRTRDGKRAAQARKADLLAAL